MLESSECSWVLEVPVCGGGSRQWTQSISPLPEAQGRFSQPARPSLPASCLRQLPARCDMTRSFPLSSVRRSCPYVTSYWQCLQSGIERNKRVRRVEGGSRCSAGGDLGGGHAARSSDGARSHYRGGCTAFSKEGTTVRVTQTALLPPHMALSCSSPFYSHTSPCLRVRSLTHVRWLTGLCLA